MNTVFFLLVAVAFGVAAWKQLATPTPATPLPMDALTGAIVDAAGTAVELAIGLIGVMALFLGLMKIMEAAGLLTVLARLMKPLMVRLFPDVPPEHPAMGAMIMNLSANFLGLGNAATPFGIKAMKELNTLNPVPGTATNAMVLFLAINTACITLLPTSVIALRAQSGSRDPGGIVVTTLLTTLTATLIAIVTAKTLQGFFPATAPAKALETTAAASTLKPAKEPTTHFGASYLLWMSLLALGGVMALVPILMVYGRVLSPWTIPALITVITAYGVIRRVAVYETFIGGAKEGFEIAVGIIPYLVGILVAIAMFRASGAMDLLLGPLGSLLAPLGLPVEALSMALLRTLSGSGSFGLLASYLKDPAIGPDSYIGYLTSTIYGSSETTFYMLAVYFGAVGIQRIRHALATGLITDAAALLSAMAICRFLYPTP